MEKVVKMDRDMTKVRMLLKENSVVFLYCFYQLLLN